MSEPVVSADPAAVQTRLRQLLYALLKQSSDCAFDSADAIADDVDLSSLGISSIDFLEFTLAVEQEFRVAILDSIEPDELPLTLVAWQQLVSSRLAG
jgi:acyl carrier protein